MISQARCEAAEQIQHRPVRERELFITCRLCGTKGSARWHRQHIIVCCGLSNEQKIRVKERTTRVAQYVELQHRAAALIQRNYRGLLGREVDLPTLNLYT